MMEQNPLRAGLATERIPPPCAVVIFGASGDLTKRKLLPALYNLAVSRLLPPGASVVGFARRPKTDAEFREEQKANVAQFSRRKPLDEAIWSDFSRGLFYCQSTFDDPAGYQKLKGQLDKLDAERGTRHNRLYYLSVPPSEFTTILDQLQKAGLVSSVSDTSRFSRVVIEKPFGTDLPSGEKLNGELLKVFDEKQVFRIDHYLGKETVQNLLVFRFANSIWEPVWNRKYIDHVEITAGEEIGIEGRGRYYEEAGILRDMLQNHVLQLVCLTAMEPPVAFDADAVRDEKLKVLRALEMIETPEQVKRNVVLGQYVEGSAGGRDVPGYQQEKDVAQGSRTPTYVALKLHIQSWRWHGVPFYVRIGKRMARRRTEIAVHFSALPHSLFGRASVPNVLVVRVQPDEGILLKFSAKVPGERYRPRSVSMDFRYGTAFGSSSPEAYERLLLDAMRGDQTLFTRRDEVEAAWKLVGNILRVTESPEGAPPFAYHAGTWGPPEADALLAQAGHAWRRL